jgi:hypothetical protein
MDALTCNVCLSTFASRPAKSNHVKRFGGKCFRPMTSVEFSTFKPSECKWKVYCLQCGRDVSKRTITKHLKDDHPDIPKDDLRNFAIIKDMNALKQGKDMSYCAHFEYLWDLKLREVDATAAEGSNLTIRRICGIVDLQVRGVIANPRLCRS